ncbi:MAG TPA: tetratricopeptide repeat protein, partial [Chthoniobacteraceae bacterium]
MNIPNEPAGADSAGANRSRFASLATLFSRTWLLAVVLIVAGIVVRTPALQGELIWDDTFLARDNPFIKSPLLAFEAFRHHLLLESLSMHYRPVQNLSYMVDYYFWNTNTYGYHLSNVLWHVGSGLLLFALLRQILPSLSRRYVVDPASNGASAQQTFCTLSAFAIALLWMVHPVHSAAIDYISGRADSLAFFFACGGWLLYLRSRKASHPASRFGCYTFAFLSTLLGLCSRESACMWLVVFVFHLFLFERSLSHRAKLLVFAGCLLVIGSYAGLRQLPEKRPTQGSSHGWSAPVKGVLMLRALGDYGRLMVFPSRLHMERTVVNSDSAVSNKQWRQHVGSDYLTILGLLVLAALVAGAVQRGMAQPLRIFGAGWFLLAYLPTSNIVDLNATVAEHWLYLPSVGALLFLAGVLLDLPRVPRKLATALVCVAVLGFSARSYVRSSDWVSNEVFYTRTLKAGGGSIRVVLNLGALYASKQEYPRAEAFFRKALQLSPTYLMARNNLAEVLYRQGKTADADRTFREASAEAAVARKEFPRTWVAALNVAKLRLDADDTPGALEVLAKARQDYPGVWRLISLESELLRRVHGPAVAMPAVQEFAQQNWWHMEAELALGKLHFEMGDLAKAEAAFRRASRLDIHDVSSLNQSALLSVTQQRFEEAYTTQRRAIARQPDEPRQYLILSDILSNMG